MLNLGTHLLTVGTEGGSKFSVVIDGRIRKIWSLSKYIHDGAVGSLVNSSWRPLGQRTKTPSATNAKYVHLQVPADQEFRFAYTSAPRMDVISVVQATKYIEVGQEILVRYGSGYDKAYLEGGHAVDTED